MLEIFLLIYLARKIKGVVEPKGYKPGKWQAYAVILWIVVEIFAVILFAGFLGADTIIAVISAYLCAIGASIALYKYAENLPDLNEGTEERRIGLTTWEMTGITNNLKNKSIVICFKKQHELNFY